MDIIKYLILIINLIQENEHYEKVIENDKESC